MSKNPNVFYYNIEGQDYTVTVVPKFKTIRIEKKVVTVSMKMVGRAFDWFDMIEPYNNYKFESVANIDFVKVDEAIALASDKEAVTKILKERGLI